MSQSVSDRNVLFGLLALQNGFITCEQFISAFSVWILDKQRALEDIFIEQRALSAERLGQLQQIVAVQADIRGPYSVQTFASISSINQLLASLKDNELKAVLQTATQDYFGPAEQLTANGQSLPADSLDIQLKSISAGSGLRYHSLRLHAKGGLGEVSVAMDRELHREVALKEIQAVLPIFLRAESGSFLKPKSPEV